MAGSLDDRASIVLTPDEYDFAIVGSLTPGNSVVYRSPFIHPKQVATALRRIANSFDQQEGTDREPNQ
jgi:hypothetical protein